MAGFSIEYAILNPSGYFMYSIYNFQGVIDPKLGKTGKIETNDLIFAIHGFSLAIAQLAQIYMYDRGSQKKSTNWFLVGFLTTEFLVVFVFFFIEIANSDLIDQGWGTIRMCGYCKAAVTFVKFIP